MKADTPGKRVYLVRLARGDGVKNPERLEDFASALSALSGKRYDGSMISRMENGGRTVSIRETELIAALDPQHRPPAWVAFGNEQGPAAAEPIFPPGVVVRAVPDPDAPSVTDAAPHRPTRRKANGR